MGIKKFPGIALCFILAVLSSYLAQFALFQKYSISTLILAIIIGGLIGNTYYHRIEPFCGRGVNYSKQQILRLAIILFGLKLTFQDIKVVGSVAILIDMSIVVSTFFITLAIGFYFFKLDRHTLILIGSGSSICGAAAVMATQPVIQAPSEKVAVAISTVVVFGTLAMVIYPIAYFSWIQAIPVSAPIFGIFTGATVHEVAQVAAVGHSLGNDIALNNAVTTKMIRVLMLAPFLFLLSVYEARKRSLGSQKSKIVIPWFAVGFIAMAGISSFHIIPTSVLKGLLYLDDILLAMAMAALGLTTHFSVIKKAGVKPLFLALVLFIWLIFGGAAINAFFISYFH